MPVAQTSAVGWSLASTRLRESSSVFVENRIGKVYRPMDEPPKIAIAFFGIIRSLKDTLHSIQSNVIAPCEDKGVTVSVAHLFDTRRIENDRTKENVEVDPEEFKLLELDQVELTNSHSDDILDVLEAAKKFGDFWEDDFQSLSNLVHQLYSLRRVTQMVLQANADVAVYCRPDIRYHDSIRSGLQSALSAREDQVLLPYWQRHKGGLNDRFAICRGEQAIRAYGFRLDAALAFCEATGQPLHAERLLRYSLERASIPTSRLDVEGSRVRANGRVEEEDFKIRRWKTFRNYVRYRRSLRS